MKLHLASIATNKMIAKYIFLGICSTDLRLLAYLASWFLALFVSASGDLPKWLSWFQPPDTKCWGDQNFWKKEMPAGRWYHPVLWYARCVVWLARNGSQGFDLHFAGADKSVLSADAVVRVEGDITITGGMEVAIDGKTRIHGRTGWFCVRIGDYWHWRNIKHWPRLGIYTTSEFGWRLQGIAEGRPHDICRQLVFTPIRKIKFV